MNKEEFMLYLQNEFDLSGSTFRLIGNILDYAEKLPCNEQYSFLSDLLSETIGLSDREIRQICL